MRGLPRAQTAQPIIVHAPARFELEQVAFVNRGATSSADATPARNSTARLESGPEVYPAWAILAVAASPAD